MRTTRSLLALLVLACGPTPTTPRLDDGAPLDGGFIIVRPDADLEPSDGVAATILDNLVCDAVAQARCVGARRCGCADNLYALVDREASCLVVERFRCLGTRDTANSLDIEGLHSVSDDMRDACAETLAAWYGDCLAPPPLSELFACARIIESAVPVGGACSAEHGQRCAGGAGRCDAGTCVAIASEIGAPCSEQCGGDLACVDGRCAAPGATGDACADHEDCDAPLRCEGGHCGGAAQFAEVCAADADCRAGLVCLEGQCRDQRGSCREGRACPHDTQCTEVDGRRCTPLIARNEICDRWGECEPGYYCPTNGEDSRCTLRVAAGGQCDDDQSSCAPGLVCDSGGPGGGLKCAVPMGLGESCTMVRCAAGLACNYDTGICGPLHALGDPCGVNDCEPGTTCNWVTDLCDVPGTVGSDCSGDTGERTCADDLSCVYYYETDRTMICEAPVGEGERCRGGQGCTDGLVCALLPEAEEWVCVPPAPSGALCGVGGACAEPDEFCGAPATVGSCEPRVCDFMRDRVID